METWTFDQVQEFVHSWGVVYFMAMFVVALAYAYWPKNKQRFQDAARIPLEEGPLEDGDAK